MTRDVKESKLQEDFAHYLDAKGLLYTASMAGGMKISRFAAVMKKRMGCKAGVPDIIILHARGQYNGMTLELKVKGGHSTPEQEQFSERAKMQGYYSVIMPAKFDVLDALEWAIKEIEYYLNLERSM